jgi:uncharacterized protein YdeI (YjbR/CyaY-like superfamily)
MDPAFFNSAAEFRAWLARRHATARELLVGLYKGGRGMTYREALDAALCFGWIDGVRKRIDADSYAVRFTPRASGSVWSAANIRRAEELISRGLMRPPGVRAFRGRVVRETSRPPLDPALDARLHANPAAASFFDAQPPGYRKTVAFWIMSAKKEETRERRLEALLERSARGCRIDLLNPDRK